MGNQKEGFLNVKKGVCHSDTCFSFGSRSLEGSVFFKMTGNTFFPAVKAAKAYLSITEIQIHKTIEVFRQFFLLKNVAIDAIIGIPATIPKAKDRNNPIL